MKVLWITNIIFPDVCKELGMKEPIVGGWMYSSAKHLRTQQGTELAVATTYDGEDLKIFILNNTTYFLLPFKGDRSKKSNQLKEFWKRIQFEFHPDIVHIFGTEFAFGLTYIEACGNKNIVVYIQGLVSVYARYYYAGITPKEIIQNITFRDLLRRNTIFQQKKIMFLRGEIEKEYIRSTQHIIGRTNWDKDHSLTINPTAKYHFCNETLREEFYKHEWSYEKCEKHTIFISQSYYPIKGLHQILKALPIVLRDFPDSKIIVTGNDLTSVKTFRERIRQNGYARYIRNLIMSLGIVDKVVFMGILSEKEIVNCFLRSNVFVCPSSIENSPNSLGEAQLMGVPCISSYVGGVPNMIEHGRTGLLYRFEEFEMLANHICTIFSNQSFTSSISKRGKSEAQKRHDQKVNVETLLSIYQKIVTT